MKSAIKFLCAIWLLSLAGCATNTLRSQVTVFHEWPRDLTDKTFAFDPSTPQERDLEYRSYESQTKARLQQLGFTDAGTLQRAALRINLDYSNQPRDVRVIEPVYSGADWEGPPFGLRRRYYGGGFADPFWFDRGVGAYRDVSYRLFTRKLKIQIVRTADSKTLYDVTVVNEGRNPTLAAVMPALIHSAFAEFPGVSGSARVIELPLAN